MRDADGGRPLFHAAGAPSQEEVEAIVYRTAKRVLRFLEKRGVIATPSAPGDGEVTIVGDDTLAETGPLLARLLAAGPAGRAIGGPRAKAGSCVTGGGARLPRAGCARSTWAQPARGLSCRGQRQTGPGNSVSLPVAPPACE